MPENESPSVEWDKYAGTWLDESPQRVWRMHSDAVNARLLARWLPASSDVLLKTDLFDEAVGDGLYSAMKQRARTVVAIDVSPKVASVARARQRSILAATADVRAIPVGDSCVDAVVSLSTLDHFNSDADIPKALAELFRILRPDGVLVLTLDNPANPVVGLRNSLPFAVVHRMGLVPYPVGKTHHMKRISNLVSEAGFEITHRTATMHAPRLLAIQILRRTESHESGLNGKLGRALMAFEKMEALPTRRFTGHFVAIRATKPG